MFEEIAKATTKTELDAAVAEIDGMPVYQKLGAVVGAIRLKKDGTYTYEGACVKADDALVSRTYSDGAALIQTKRAGKL